MMGTGSIKSYFFGFAFSVVLTVVSFGMYIFYSNRLISLPAGAVVTLLLLLAVLQLFVQLIFFLHLGHEKGARWNLIFFVSTASIFIMVVVASLWIMYHLNYNMMPHQMEEYLLWKEGIHKD